MSATDNVQTVKRFFAALGGERKELLALCAEATNKTFEDYFVFAITVRDGKVTNLREYVDTQALARASANDG